jgi:hypothetical protein
MNGIKAEIVLMDPMYLKESKGGRLFYDWAVLRLFPHERDPRITKNKMLTCNFGYDFNEESDRLIKIPGYPNEQEDFTTSPSRQGSYVQIDRNKDEDICALYFHEMSAH